MALILKEGRENFHAFVKAGKSTKCFHWIGIKSTGNCKYLLFNLLSLASRYFIPRGLNIEKRQAIAIGMEIGIHNGTLAIYIALSGLANSSMAVPPAIYSLPMFFTAALFGYLVKNNRMEKAVR